MGDIYELFNDAEMNVEEFENQKLSDAERKFVKQQMKKEFRNRKRSKKRRIRTTGTAVACACIVIVISTSSAAAGLLKLPESLMTILGIHTDEEYRVANTIGVPVHIMDEDHGYRISADGVIGDGKNAGIIFKIEKSDGSALLDRGEVPATVEFREIDNGDHSWLHAEAGTVEGSNRADCIEYYLTFTYRDIVKDQILISLEDMQLQAEGQQFRVFGKWEFDIPFGIRDVSVDLAAGQKFRYGNSEGSIEELRISPFGFSVRIMTSDPLSDSDFIDIPMEIHKKNGEVAALDGGCGPEDHEDGTWSWKADGAYEQMMLLEDMECVVIGDTEFAVKFN